MRHSGELFELPHMPEQSLETEMSLCKDISRCAAEAILAVEIKAIFTRWKGLIEEHGLRPVADIYNRKKEE